MADVVFRREVCHYTWITGALQLNMPEPLRSAAIFDDKEHSFLPVDMLCSYTASYKYCQYILASERVTVLFCDPH
ncbi:MAG: hypothetical protein N3G75_06670 [Methanothrix sp.]|nr:hypothetical protein [Methanothrix sp.]MCX8207499.1 hypothetical protein [Methanothrix sp.]